MQIYVLSFLSYASVHTLRTTYSCSKKDIANQVNIEYKFMGIVDALMLGFLGIGHFLHTLRPIKKPVKSLFVAMMLCSLSYGLIPFCTYVHSLSNIYVVSLLMCFNGYLQSYTWPNLLMVIHSKFPPEIYTVSLGFWATNANVGNIIGFSIFLALGPPQVSFWQLGIFLASTFLLVNGGLIALRFKQIGITPKESVRQKSFMHYLGMKERRRSKHHLKKSVSSEELDDSLIQKSVKSVRSQHSLDSVQSRLSLPTKIGHLSKKSIKSLSEIQAKLSNGEIRSLKIVKQPQKVAETPLSITEVFKDPNVVLLTITFSLSKSVIYGIMLWLPLYFQQRDDLKSYGSLIPITYDGAAIFGSVAIGYLFKKVVNKGLLMIPFMIVLFICFLFLKLLQFGLSGYFITISVVGFSLGGIFNTLSGLVVMELTKVIPETLKTSSLGFYSALTMAMGNFTTALTQVLIGFVLGKESKNWIIQTRREFSWCS